MNLSAFFIRCAVSTFVDDKTRVVTPAKAEAYDPATHPQQGLKFLFWQNGDDALLLVGDDLLHLDMVESARSAGIQVPSAKPNGAGNLLSLDGTDVRIVQWHSAGYGVGTPRGLRPTLMAMISPTATEAIQAAAEPDDEERRKLYQHLGTESWTDS